MKTRITELFGIDYPILLSGMSWISVPKMVAAVSNAGGLGILATGPPGRGRHPGRDPRDPEPHRQTLRLQRLAPLPGGGPRTRRSCSRRRSR